MGEKIYIDHTRKKWWILIIIQITYLCTGHYTWTLGIAFGFDFLANFLWSSILRRGAASIAIDLVIRAAIVVAGATLNAFFAYVFDLSFFQGSVYLFWGVVLFLYIWIVKLMPSPTVVVDDARDVHPVTPPAKPRPRPPVEGLDEFYVRLMANIDFVFFGALAIFSLMYRDVLIFAEPWTYGLYYAYSVSVLFTVVVATVRGMEWWSALIFLLFWIAVMGAAYPIDNALHKQRKYPLSMYFQ